MWRMAYVRRGRGSPPLFDIITLVFLSLKFSRGNIMKSNIAKFFSTVVCCFLLAGCVAPLTHVSIHSEFDADEAAHFLKKGNNTIKGSALIRQRGGGIVTCAGNRVTLIPYTKYSAERIGKLYGNTTGGAHSYTNIEFINDPPDYTRLTRNTKCNAQGFFTFTDVANGIFFVVTSALWEVPISQYTSSQQGGALMRQVEVINGETKEIVLTP